MKKLLPIAYCMLPLVLLAGCASNKSKWEQYLDNYPVPKGMTARFATINDVRRFAEEIPAPLPEKTPYDASKEERDQYLQGFALGWDYAVSGGSLKISNNQVGTSKAWMDGFDDGKKEYSEPMAKFVDRIQHSMRTLHR